MWAFNSKEGGLYLFVCLFIVLLRQGLTTEPKLALNLKQSSFLPRPPDCWDYSHAPPLPVKDSDGKKLTSINQMNPL